MKETIKPSQCPCLWFVNDLSSGFASLTTYSRSIMKSLWQLTLRLNAPLEMLSRWHLFTSALPHSDDLSSRYVWLSTQTSIQPHKSHFAYLYFCPVGSHSLYCCFYLVLPMLLTCREAEKLQGGSSNAVSGLERCRGTSLAGAALFLGQDHQALLEAD